MSAFSEDGLEKDRKEYKEWEERTLKKTISKRPERKKEFYTTVDGIKVKQIYTPADLADMGWDYFKDLGYPGQYPFTRGVFPTGYRGKVWTMREYAGYATAEETNRRYKYLYGQGQTGFSVAFHLPTQEGYDSDHPLAAGEVGKCGVTVDSLQDMERLWDGIPLADVSTSMTINATAPMVLAMYIAAAEGQGADSSKLRGTVQNDILKEYIARNTYIFAVEPSMKLVTDVCEYCANNMPAWNSISISGYHIRESGSTAAQEAAFTLANGIEYVRAMIDRGMNVDSFAPRFSFFFAANNNIFEEAAKFRAMRRMWARIMKEWFGAEKPRSMMLRFHTQTDGFTLTEQQPLNNAIRVAYQALAAALGGTQSLHTNSFDEALALPSEEAVTLALRTQQVLAEESGVTDVVDPLAGSYYVEYLTNKIEEDAMDYIGKIEDMGGAAKAIEKGYVQREIIKAAHDYQKAVDSKEEIVVGVNKYAMEEEEKKLELLRVDPEVERGQIERVRKLRKDRDDDKVEGALDKVRKAAEREENVMPPLINAAKAYATIGEMSDVFRELYGEYREPSIF